jgi:excisionase family DNA binding protein
MPTLAGMENTQKFLDGYLSKQEAQEYTSLSLRTLDYAKERGELPVFKVGRRVLFKRSDLDRWLERFRADVDLDRIVEETVAEVLGK